MKMGIQDLREQLKPIPGAGELTMHYEDGGKVQVLTIRDVSVRVDPRATIEEIRTALIEAIEAAPA